MPETPDSYLIKRAQDCISWFEIHTFLVRKNIGEILSIANTFFMSMHVVAILLFISLVGFLETADLTILIGIVIFIQYRVRKTLQKNIAKVITQQIVLPKEIKSRKVRRNMLCISILLFLFICIKNFVVGRADLLALEIFLMSFLLILTLIEYFLCTTGFPPSVIEQKKGDIGLKNMALSGT
jgi:hypothetical protein